MSKDLGDGAPQGLQPSSYPAFTPTSAMDDRQQPIRSTSSGRRAVSGHEERRPSVSDITESRRSISSAQIRPLPTAPVTEYNQGGDAVDPAFDPQDLLQMGLGEWQNRALSLRTLRRTSSIAAAYRGLEPKPSLKFDRQQSARRSHESYEGTEESLEAVQGSSKSVHSAGNRYPPL